MAAVARPSRPCVIGIDGGGTKTLCIVAAEDGTELGRALGGPSNYQTRGETATREVLAETIGAALQAAGGARAGTLEVRAICYALAGVDRPDDIATLRRLASEIAAIVPQQVPGVQWTARAHAETTAIVNDAVASLVGGSGRKLGVVVVAGTGSIAFGLNARGERCRAGGWGRLLGDEGSGYDIGISGLRAVCRAADGRGPPTALTPLVLDAFGLREAQQLIGLAYGSWGVAEIAAVAPLVLRAAGEGDEVAGTIVDHAASELALAATTVIHRLELEQAAFDVVTSGGLWQGSARLCRRFATLVASAAPHATITPPRAEPAAGAVLLAREVLGLVDLAGSL